MKTNKKGISLIVLVITIIVMIILAAAVVLTLAQNGIIGKANEAVDEMNEAQVRAAAQLAWTDISLNDENKDGWTKEDWTFKVTQKLESDGVDISDFTIKATKDGVTVTKKPAGGTTVAEGWTQTGTTVTDGSVTLNVGAYIDYKANVDGYTDENGWIVLGAEDGELLIMSANNVVDEFALGQNSTDPSVSKEDYITGVSKLDNECIKYGDGEHATHVRSVRMEDIDRVAMYNPDTFTGQDYFDYMINHNGWTEESLMEDLEEMGGVSVLEAMNNGSVVTFKWDDTRYPKFNIMIDGEKQSTTYSLTVAHDSFMWYDDESKCWRESARKTTANEQGTMTSDDEDKKTITLKNDHYAYKVEDKIASNTLAYEKLIGTTNLNNYWFANSMTQIHTGYIIYSIGVLNGGKVNGNAMIVSCGIINGWR